MAILNALAKRRAQKRQRSAPYTTTYEAWRKITSARGSPLRGYPAYPAENEEIDPSTSDSEFGIAHVPKPTRYISSTTSTTAARPKANRAARPGQVANGAGPTREIRKIRSPQESAIPVSRLNSSATAAMAPNSSGRGSARARPSG